MPTDLQAPLTHPERLLVAHPFNPVYLLPCVELVAGEKTDPAALDRVDPWLSALGMKPVRVRKEIEAFIADRLLEAVWREALWLVKDGIGTTEDIDEIVRQGFGLRWAQMGVFETYRLAGGEASMRHFLAQFGPCLKWPWTKLTDVPDFDDALIDLIAGQSDAQSGHLSIRDLVRHRDDNLIAILQALKGVDWGAGSVLATYEKGLYDRGAARPAEPDFSAPFETVNRRVPPDWTDYNGHMNEARYLQCFGDATDATMAIVGADAAYIASGYSYFTAETHIRHLDEANSQDPIRVTTQILGDGTPGKKLHLFHRMLHEDGRLLATGEHLLLHVSLESRATCAPQPAVADKLGAIAAQQVALPVPDGAGRAVGQRP